MASSRAIAFQNLPNLFTNPLRLRVEHGWVHIALQRDLVTHPCASRANIGCPVETYCIGAAASNLLQPLAATLGEDNDGHTPAIRFSR